MKKKCVAKMKRAERAKNTREIYRRKLAKEFEKVESLKAAKDEENAKWDEQNSALYNHE